MTETGVCAGNYGLWREIRTLRDYMSERWQDKDSDGKRLQILKYRNGRRQKRIMNTNENGNTNSELINR